MIILIILVLFFTLLPLVPILLARMESEPEVLNKRLDSVRELRETPEPQSLLEDDGEKANVDRFRELLEGLSRIKPIQVVFAPRTELDKKQMKLLLAQAGWGAAWALEVYVALRFLGGAIGFFFASGAHLGFYGLSTYNMVYGLAGALAGAAVPAAYICSRRRKRQKSIFHSLPDFLDLVVIAVEVGQGPDRAMREAISELHNLNPALSQEFKLFFNQLDLGRPRRDALHDLGLRVGLAEMSYMVNTLIQANRFGSGVGVALADLSQRMRIRLQQLSQERAQQVAFKLMFPMVLFIFPGVFVALVGPAAIMIARDILSTR